MAELPPPIRSGCAACQQLDATIVETMALCPACRTKFTKLNLPTWLRFVSGLLAIIVFYNLARMPFLVSTMISSERQKSAMEADARPSQSTFFESGP